MTYRTLAQITVTAGLLTLLLLRALAQGHPPPPTPYTLPFAQVISPRSVVPNIAWDQGATDQANASAMTYRYYLDGATTGSPIANATCTPEAPPTGYTSPPQWFACTGVLPEIPSGPHTLQLTCETSPEAKSEKSTPPYSFTWVPSTAPQGPGVFVILK